VNAAGRAVVAYHLRRTGLSRCVRAGAVGALAVLGCHAIGARHWVAIIACGLTAIAVAVPGVALAPLTAFERCLPFTMGALQPPSSRRLSGASGTIAAPPLIAAALASALDDDGTGLPARALLGLALLIPVVPASYAPLHALLTARTGCLRFVVLVPYALAMAAAHVALVWAAAVSDAGWTACAAVGVAALVIGPLVCRLAPEVDYDPSEVRALIENAAALPPAPRPWLVRLSAKLAAALDWLPPRARWLVLRLYGWPIYLAGLAATLAILALCCSQAETAPVLFWLPVLSMNSVTGLRTTLQRLAPPVFISRRGALLAVLAPPLLMVGAVLTVMWTTWTPRVEPVAWSSPPGADYYRQVGIDRDRLIVDGPVGPVGGDEFFRRDDGSAHALDRDHAALLAGRLANAYRERYGLRIDAASLIAPSPTRDAPGRWQVDTARSTAAIASAIRFQRLMIVLMGLALFLMILAVGLRPIGYHRRSASWWVEREAALVTVAIGGALCAVGVRLLLPGAIHVDAGFPYAGVPVTWLGHAQGLVQEHGALAVLTVVGAAAGFLFAAWRRVAHHEFVGTGPRRLR